MGNNYTSDNGAVVFYGKMIPADPAVTWVNDLLRLSWLENYGTNCQYEIFRSYNGGEFLIVNTTALGASSYDYSSLMGVEYQYKIRTLQDGVPSEFCQPVRMAQTPLVFRVITVGAYAFNISTFNVGAGNIIIDYGDGTALVTLTGNNVNVAHNYAGAGTWYVKIYGAIAGITNFDVAAVGEVAGSLTRWMIPDGTANLTIAANACAITGLPRGNFRRIINANFNANAVAAAETSAFVVAMDEYFVGAVVPLGNMTVDIAGAGMGALNAAGLAAKASLAAKFVAAGFVLTLTNN